MTPTETGFAVAMETARILFHQEAQRLHLEVLFKVPKLQTSASDLLHQAAMMAFKMETKQVLTVEVRTVRLAQQEEKY